MRPLVVLFAALLALPASAGHGRGHGRGHDHAHGHSAHGHGHGKGKGHSDRHGREWSEAHGIPAGHLPPPGSCRVWFPGEPPGHQPPPTSCAKALRDAPRGAWVVERRPGHDAVVFAHVPRPRRAATRAYTVVYDGPGGLFVRVEWR